MVPLNDRDPELRVLHVVDHMGSGGAQQVVVSLSNWLSARGADIHITGGDGASADRLDAAVSFVPSARRAFVAQTAHLIALCRELRPHVIHAHQRREALQAAAAGRTLGIPVVEHAHTVLPRLRLRTLSFRSERVFAVGPAVARMVIDGAGVSPDRVLTVGNAPAQVSNRPPTAVRYRTDRALRVLAVGRLTEQKDPLRFVRMVAELSTLLPTRARWLGEGELLGAARAEARRLGAPVEFAGPSQDVVAELDRADCLVLTSRWEGTPLVVLEAFARKRAVVATASAANGLLADSRGEELPDDVSDREFARRLSSLVRDAPRVAATTEHAYRYVTEVASPDRVFAPVLAAYRELAGSRG